MTSSNWCAFLMDCRLTNEDALGRSREYAIDILPVPIMAAGVILKSCVRRLHVKNSLLNCRCNIECHDVLSDGHWFDVLLL